MSPANAIAELLTSKRHVFVCLARRYAPHGIDAEDVVQDAAVQALRFAGQFEGRSQLSTWFGTIVRNCALMQKRRFRVMDATADFEDVLDYLPDPHPGAEAMFLADANHKRLITAITRLSIPLRESLLLRMAGLRHQEIADRLGVPLGTVKARLSRGKNQIRKRIAA